MLAWRRAVVAGNLPAFGTPEFDSSIGLRTGDSDAMQMLYNMGGMYKGAAHVADTDFSNLFWPKHELSLGELGTWFGHFANLVRPEHLLRASIVRVINTCT